MSKQLISFCKKWWYVFRYDLFDEQVSLERYLFGKYVTHSIDKEVLRNCITGFVREGLPLLKNKLVAEMGEDRFQKEQKELRQYWFEHYVVWAYESVLKIDFQSYIAYSLYSCAERELYRQLSWQEVVRNIPAGCWLNTYGLGTSAFLHLALGSNIRRHPDYSHFTRKMAHVFNTADLDGYARQPNGMDTLLIALGSKQATWEVSAALRQCLEWPYEAEAFRKVIPLAERLLTFHQSGLVDELIWNKINLYLESNWKQRSRQILQLKTAEQFQSAVDRHFMTVEAQIKIDELMAKHNYSSDDSWEAGPLKSWNLCKSEGWYHILELRSPSALVYEGARMHHCVGSYVDECLNNGYHIYSLRFRAHGKTKWRSLVTMAVREKFVIEMYGVLNTDVVAEHRTLIDKWLAQEGSQVLLEN